MNGTAPDRLYNLMPAVYRIRDQAQGEPLRALLSLIQQQYNAVEQDISGLYENWFIETCAEWVVPYIGDLLAVRPIYAASTDTFSARAYVANTLDFRRKKGTAAMLEQLALDVTGWPAHVVEFFQLIATTQYLNHLRPTNLATADLRNADSLQLLGGPFEQTAHSVDVRRISIGGGKYNIPSVGIFLWRLEDYPVGPIPISSADPTKPDLHGASRQSDARAVASTPDGRFTFDPLGTTAPLFNNPQSQAAATTLIAEINVPGPLRLRPLYEELEALRQAKVDGLPAPSPVYFGNNPVFQIILNGSIVPFIEVMVCDISDISPTDWRRPLASKSYTPSGGGAAVAMPIVLSVDPVRGRIAFPAGVTPASVEVAYTYGFSGDLGAGTFDRTTWLSDPSTGPAPFANPNAWQVGVSQELTADGITLFGTLASAVQAWNLKPAGTSGVIAILDSRTYHEDLTGTSGIVVPAGSQLLIVAADWPAARQSTPAKPGGLVPDGFRPHLLGSLTVTGSAPAGSTNAGSLYIDGLLVEGVITIENGNLGTFGLSHSSIAPTGGLTVLSSGAAGGDNDGLIINLFRAICGPIALAASVPTLNTVDSIITSGASSANTAAAVTAPGATVDIQTTTVLGTTSRTDHRRERFALHGRRHRDVAGKSAASAFPMFRRGRKRAAVTSASPTRRSLCRCARRHVGTVDTSVHLHRVRTARLRAAQPAVCRRDHGRFRQRVGNGCLQLPATAAAHHKPSDGPGRIPSLWTRGRHDRCNVKGAVMRGDFTRWSFDPAKHYHGVLKQQGRVDLDADWNEQNAITAHRIEEEAIDVIGASGAPAGDAGFVLAAATNGASLTISKGRAYVDGILCENEQAIPITSQPDFPGFQLPTAAGVYVAYLKVWLRHITSLDDQGILEAALGGPDTCTRSRTVWQVNLASAGAVGASVNCATDVPALDTA